MLPLAATAAVPTVQLKVNNSSQDLTVTPGTTLSITATAADAEGDMSEHWLEIRNPAGAWSWEGWLTTEPWLGALAGTSRSSTKSGTFKFDQTGVYQVRATALDSHNVWIISNVVYVAVQSSSQPTTGAVGEPVVTVPPAPVTEPTPSAGGFANAGFEAVAVGSNTFDAFRYQLSGAGWTFSRDAGVSGNRSGFTDGNPVAPEGAQVGFIQFQGSARQTVQLAAGTYRISALAAQRVSWQQQAQSVNVLVGDRLVGNLRPADASYTAVSTPTFTVPAGNHTVAFVGTATLDGTVFLDQVSISAVVEPPVVIAPEPQAPPPVVISPPPASVATIFDGSGAIDPAKYIAFNQAWDKTSMSARLGPTFAQLNPGAADTRPTHFKPASRSCSLSYANKIDPYELGPSGGCYADDDYWSESGQVAYVADASTNPGLDRVQVYAYYDNVFALSPRLDYASGETRPDAQTKESNYFSMLGRFPMQPVAMVRGYGMLQNEALVIYKDGLLGIAGTQTSRAGHERPYPGILFPSHKVPTSIAVTAGNELALVTIWDTQARRGQLAVVALEGKYIPFHTWPWMGMQNQGSFSDLKLLGYVDLPVAAPSSVAAASNGWWNGPSQTNNLVLSEIDLTKESVRTTLRDGDAQWSSIVATKGYAIVASKQENKAVLVDLSPVFHYIRDSYLSSTASFNTTVSTRGNGPGQWPLTFAERPATTPRVVWQTSVATPTTVLAGVRLDRWSKDRHKAYVACEDGTIHIVDTSSLMARHSWEIDAPISVLGTTRVGRNPVSMAFTRHLDYPLAFLPRHSNGSLSQADPLNNTFYVACRGDRRIDTVVTYAGAGTIYRTISDTRLADPVGVSVCGRGNIVSITDFEGKKLHSFRVGGIWDRYSRYYGPGADGRADFEYTGSLDFPGYPFAVNSANVN